MSESVQPAEERAPLTPPQSSGMAPRTEDQGLRAIRALPKDQYARELARRARIAECQREIAAVLGCNPEDVRILDPLNQLDAEVQ